MKNPSLSLFALSPLFIIACTDLGEPAPATAEATGDITAETTETAPPLTDEAAQAAETQPSGEATQAADAAEVVSRLSAQRANKLSAAAAGPITTIENCDGRLEQFRVSTTNSAEHRWQQSAGGSWSGWASLGGELLYGDLTAFPNYDCKIEVFGTGTNHAVFTTWQSTAGSHIWISWASIGGYLISAPVWAKNLVGFWGVCAIGKDSNLWCNFHTQAGGSPWTGWHKQ